MESEPNPGSLKALDLGCICAVIDNRYGRGIPTSAGGKVFYITMGCPVHTTVHSVPALSSVIEEEGVKQ